MVGGSLPLVGPWHVVRDTLNRHLFKLSHQRVTLKTLGLQSGPLTQILVLNPVLIRINFRN